MDKKHFQTKPISVGELKYLYRVNFWKINYREPEKYTIDYGWYISNQILPPISRLCDPES